MDIQPRKTLFQVKNSYQSEVAQFQQTEICWTKNRKVPKNNIRLLILRLIIQFNLRPENHRKP